MARKKTRNAEQKAKNAAYQREYYKRNRDLVLAKKAVKAAQFLDEVRDNSLKSAKKRLREIKTAIFDKYGNRCARCGFDDPRAFQVDHVNGGGTRDKESFPSGWSYWRHVLEDQTGKFQLLCANCNQIKRCEEQEHRSWGYTRNPPGERPSVLATG